MKNYKNIIGVGFGPSNMAVSVAFHHALKQDRTLLSTDMLFLEKSAEFDWHPGMLIEDADMQISFVKDLITLKDPTSEFTFLNYLRLTKGLQGFVNSRTLYPSRLEFRNYLRWAAAKMSSKVQYGTKVLAVTPVVEADVVTRLKVDALVQGNRQTFATSYLLLATGGRPRKPACLEGLAAPRVIHSSKFKPSLASEFSDQSKPHRFVVVGGGQSAAEMFRHLYRNYPKAEVSWVVSGFSIKPADDTEFVNEVFDPDAVTRFYDAPGPVRESMLADYANTNYSVVDRDLIADIYRSISHEKRHGRGRLSIVCSTRLEGVEEAGEVLHLELLCTSTQRRRRVVADGVFLGTGYDSESGLELLGALDGYLERHPDGRLRINRDYSLEARKNFLPKVFVQGATESSHGLTSTLLSVLPFRAGEIMDAIRADMAWNANSAVADVRCA